MRIWIAITAIMTLTSTSWASGENKDFISFFPENNLHLEDSIESTSNISEVMFHKIINTAKNVYNREAQANDETLVINANWSTSTVNANVRRAYGQVIINMYGGLARRSEVTPHGFTLVLCHELGHAYGGAPYLQAAKKLSAEGQADYYGAQECLRRVISSMRSDFYSQPSNYINDVCRRDSICENQLAGAESLGSLLSKMKGDRLPSFSTPDQNVVNKTELSYPKTVQCRLDSYHNGILGMARPKCWFKP